MSEPVKIVITLDGGLVQGVISMGIPVEYIIVDYDTDGADENELFDCPQDDAAAVKAFAYDNMAHIDGPWCEEVYAAFAEWCEERDDER